MEALAKLLSLEHTLREIGTLNELAFFIAHQTSEVIAYEKAVIWQNHRLNYVEIKSFSNLSDVDNHSEFSLGLRKFIGALRKQLPSGQAAELLHKHQQPLALQRYWPKSLSDDIIYVSFRDDDTTLGGALFSGQGFDDSTLDRLQWLTTSYHYYWAKLARPKHFLKVRKLSKKTKAIALSVAIGVLFLRVPTSTIAPASVIAKSPLIITAPMEGVIKSLHIDPNQTVVAGDILLTLDDKELINANYLAQKELAIAAAKHRKAIQTGFHDISQRAEINILRSEIDIKQLEMDYTNQVLSDTIIRAPNHGVAIIDNKQELIGKPVATGEKILEIADPASTQIEIWLPLQDAIVFQEGSSIKLFPDNQPFNTINGTVTYVSYTPKHSPHGTLAFRILADVDSSKHAQIGTQGSSKIMGSATTLFQYLLRKPIATLRQTVGW